jgi:transposase InsO family protein
LATICDQWVDPEQSRRGNCWDNAVAESFFSSLKKEHVEKKIYKNRLIARGAIATGCWQVHTLLLFKSEAAHMSG